MSYCGIEINDRHYGRIQSFSKFHKILISSRILITLINELWLDLRCFEIILDDNNDDMLPHCGQNCKIFFGLSYMNFITCWPRNHIIRRILGRRFFLNLIF
ncbi:hypothetical protein DERP_001945 [Dermatophagoides pteronyssinus]|uniref:Uncharacterized protein n=1 Tax=Dermatophagoides pteronyssinus TaxID=6956 RepID=A0ABQ8JBW3_DERPT|nr:hypothetical protein DERP_001945 [Dermatophagoides pteronyssinus]